MILPLHDRHLSLDTTALGELLTQTQNLLIIQDLDGVCMGLVNDPLTREIDPSYVAAARQFGPHFYVLTNGEHIGRRGVNRIVEQAISPIADQAITNCGDKTPLASGQYLPGLAAGGIQWQGRDGVVTHPGVSDVELAFLQALPDRMAAYLRDFFTRYPAPADLETYIRATVLDNIASPSLNLNSLYPAMVGQNEIFIALQTELKLLLEALLAEAAQQGLSDSFFIHYAPNLGRGANGKEIVWFSEPGNAGTTDFQFMLRGAVKEAGVLALLNQYYFWRTGSHPLGENFSAREAPRSLVELVALAKEKLDPSQMPLIVGVGDTVTSQVQDGQVRRGGSDRNFLQLIQDLNEVFDCGNLTVYVDSSGGELKNRQPLRIETVNGSECVIQGPGDAADPLRLNVALPGGYQQYCELFIAAANERRKRNG